MSNPAALRMSGHQHSGDRPPRQKLARYFSLVGLSHVRRSIAVVGNTLLRPTVATIAVALPIILASLSCLGTPAGGAGHAGVFPDRILFGQSAVLSGPSQELGKGMRLGIETAFNEVNLAGGVHGRELELETLDDSYEPDYAAQATEWLIEEERVFALIGAVGTPTSRVAAPLAQEAGVPFLGPFTGADFLRDPALDSVINVRASYHQETEAMVLRLTEHLGISRVAVLYQDDSFGQTGLEGVRRALEQRGLEAIGSWRYQRNADVADEVATAIVGSNPEAVIIIGTHRPVAGTVKAVRREIDPVFMTVSFGGGTALEDALGKDGEGVYVTQVVPFPQDASIPLVARYHAALAEYSPQAQPGFVSLEGYLAGRVAAFGLDVCGPEINRECFMDALRTSEVISVDGFLLTFGPADNQGSDSVFLTVIGSDGKYRRSDKLELPY